MRRNASGRSVLLGVAGLLGAFSVAAVVGLLMAYASATGELPPSASPYVEVGAAGASQSPLLLLVPDESPNPLRGYLSEILIAEGLNAFDVRSPAQIDASVLHARALVVLGEGTVDPAKAALLAGYVAAGGRLVVVRPGSDLDEVCGVVGSAERLDGGYLVRDPSESFGLPSDGLQFHGEAGLYRLAGADAVAWLSHDGRLSSGHPAVTRHRYGEGEAVMWAFDLGRSVALTRQGDPRRSNQERDGLPGLRAQDAMVDWIDLERLGIPQADVQMRLFSGLMGSLLGDVLPLPRLWYFPEGADSVLLATGDAHGATAAVVDDVLARVEKRGGRMSVYYAPAPGSRLRRALGRVRGWVSSLPALGAVLGGADRRPTAAHVARWRGRGHEFGLHPYVEDGLEAGWSRSWREFTGYGYGPVPPTVRTHAVQWHGWIDTPRHQASLGIRLNLDAYHIGPALRRPDGEWVFGQLTGSGLPMRYVDEQGRLLNVHQVNTQLVDEQLLNLPWGPELARYPVDRALEVSRALLASGTDGGYSAFCAQFHLDPFGLEAEWRDQSARWLDGTLDEAARLGFPIWTAFRFSRFVRARVATRFDQLRWDPVSGELTFTLDTPAADDVSLTVLLPDRVAGQALSRVTVDGTTAALGRRAVAGLEWRSFSALPGQHQVAAVYGPPPR